MASADDVFGSVFDSTILLFIGSFIIAEAMLVHGLDRRLAFKILSLRLVGSSTNRIIIAFGFIGAATSPFMSNTGAAAMMLPIALGVMASVGRLIIGQAGGEDRPERLRFGAGLMLVITYSITVGGLLLPSEPPNLIGRALIRRRRRADHLPRVVPDGVPIVLVMFVALLVVVLWLNRPEVKQVEGSRSSSPRRRAARPADPVERNTLSPSAWPSPGTLPGLVGLFLGDDSKLYET